MNDYELALDVNFMFRTAFPEIYEELCKKKSLFKMEIHLFSAALAIGLQNNAYSQNKPHHDIVRLNQLLKEEHREVRDVINIMSQIAYTGSDKKARGDAIIAYADGGLELLWKDYQTQGTLDIPRILDESKKKWPERILEMSHMIEERDASSFQ